MAEEAKIAPEEVANNTEPAIQAEAPQVEAKNEETLGETFRQPEPKKENGPRMVPEAVFLEVKNELKSLKREISESGMTKSEVSKSLQEIGERHDVDPGFLQELASAIRSETEAELNQRLEKELEPLKAQEEEARSKKIDKVFNEHFKKTLESMPEYEGIANKDVIKTLAMDPANANKTFAQIVESAYGHLVEGKRSLDSTHPGSGRSITEIDFARAKTDTKYFQQIMDNPALKQKYNEELPKRLNL